MEVTTIDRLPIEMLMKIFSHLERYDDVCLVNKLFYNVACEVNDFNNCVTFDSIFLENRIRQQSIMESIHSTHRQIRKLKINFGNRVHDERIRQSATFDVAKIVKKFSATITYFELEDISMNMSNLLEILSLLPNAEHLVLRNVCKHPLQRERLSIGNLDIMFRQLKTLSVTECDEAVLSAVSNRLPAGVLKEFESRIRRPFFEYSFVNSHLLANLFMQQSNIKQLKLELCIASSTACTGIFDNLKLESLELVVSEYFSNLGTILSKQMVMSEYFSNLSKQTELKSLIMIHLPADDALLDVITNHLTNMETLEINVAHTSTLKNIVKLKKLKNLKLKTCSLKLLETFAGLDNSQINALSIWNYEDVTAISIDLICALAKSVPNLKVLKFGFYLEFGWRLFSAIMQNFNFIESLELNIEDMNLEQYNNPITDCVNQNLTTLKIIDGSRSDESLLENLITAYPNLKELSIFAKDEPTMMTSHFKLILDGFTQLESLELLFGGEKLITNFLDYLKVKKNNLKSIILKQWCCCDVTADELKEKFRGVFYLIKFENKDYNALYMGNKPL